MIMVMIWVIYMVMIFLFLFIYSMYLYMEKYGVFLEWVVFSMNSVNLEMIVLIDWISCLFVSFVILISSMIMLYSLIYMVDDKFMMRFMILVMLFVMSMILMIISPNVVSILLGWDGLGLISYCLVIYYQNYSSYNSGMITVLTNRLGDIGILMSIGMMIMYGSWNMFMIGNEKMDKFIMIMIMLAAITKSAQLPFSSWLPMAMAAPTPVSALVHSSTLVTAGVYLMIRFNKFLMYMNLNIYLLFLSLMTMLMSGMMALMEYDLKKIIALSTLSQLGMMMMILSLGHSLVSLYHLLVHAIFKSMLFMCAGIIIHSMFNNQDIRMFGNLNEFIPMVMMSFYIALFSLCGVPFMSGFYSKDLIMELIYLKKINMIMYMLIIYCLILTVMYSIRLFYYLYLGTSIKFNSFIYFKESSLMNKSMIILIVMSIIGGSLMNWLFMMDFKMPYLNIYMKMMTLMVCMFSVFFWLIMMKMKYFKVVMYYYFSSMWFLNYMYIYLYVPVLKFGIEMSKMDKSWLEFMSKDYFMNFINLNVKLKYNYKIFIFMYLFCLMIIMKFLII
nr:NADH dehydrogenase subunit 5 [Proceratium itoi]